MSYPDVDLDVSGYTAVIRFDSGDGSIPPFELSGRHATFASAARRARKVATALIAAGEVGAYAWVGFSGERPAGFPRNGVKL